MMPATDWLKKKVLGQELM